MHEQRFLDDGLYPHLRIQGACGVLEHELQVATLLARTMLHGPFESLTGVDDLA